MKTKLSFVKSVILFAVLFLSLGNIVNAQQLNEYAIKNLKAGINSENPGLRKSAIYFAGKYKVTVLAEELIKQYSKENDYQIRKLIALSLFKIADESGMELVKNMSHNDENAKVRHLATSLFDVYANSRFSDNLYVSGN